jgi:hypothetical protein
MEAACKINIGTFYQTVFFSNGQRIREDIPLCSLPTFFAKEKDIEVVYLAGAPIDFLKEIEEETNKLEQSMYADKKPTVFCYKI